MPLIIGAFNAKLTIKNSLSTSHMNSIFLRP
uniref:Uncharacterized protein n=1 Tax=Nelumbo nucifera TaxID=4432 RepID=A0A822Y032_NELNU|nr:TPA_asm: hypothetical protein HUJ06_026827 [Nelumbo nucifera]